MGAGTLRRRAHEMIAIENGELIHGGAPGIRGALPRCRDVAQREPQKCRGGLVIWEMAARFDDLAELRVRSTLSSPLVVSIRRRISGGNAKKGITCVQARRHATTTVGNFRPQGLRSKSSRAAPAASALGAV